MKREPHVLELLINPRIRVNTLEPDRWDLNTLIARAAARVVDLRDVMDVLDEVVVECLAGIDNGERVLDNIYVAKDTLTQFYLPLHQPLPMLAEPRIALEGWYLFEDGVAGFLEPLSDTHYVLDLWFRTPTGQVWAAGVSTMISLDPVVDWDVVHGHYGVVVNYWYWATYAKRAGITTEEDDVKRLQQMFNNTSVLESAAVFGYVVLLANSFALADPRVILHKDTSTKLLKAAARRKRPKVARYTTIDLPGLRYDSKRGSFSAKRGDGVAWHMVRGHYRTLTAERFANKKGQRVWVRPHTRGHEDHGITKGAYTITSARGKQG